MLYVHQKIIVFLLPIGTYYSAGTIQRLEDPRMRQNTHFANQKLKQPSPGPSLMGRGHPAKYLAPDTV